MRRALSLILALLASLPAAADMYQDASNAKLPEARANLGAWPAVDAVKDLGCVGDGVTINTACMTAAAATTGNPNVYFAPGTYLMGCGPYTFASSATIIGASRETTKLKLTPGCTLPSGPGGASPGVFNMTNGSGGGWRDLTIDVAGTIDPDVVGQFSQIIRYVCQNAFLIDNISMVDVGDSSIGISTNANNCTSRGWALRNSRIHQTGQNPAYYSHGLTLGGGTASFHDVHIDGNYFENTGIQITGTDIFVTNNDFSGWAFGAAVYVAPRLGFRHVVTGNIFHDSATSVDVNATAAHALESHGEHLVFANNICRNLGGGCVKQFGSFGLFEGNISENAFLTTDPTVYRSPYQVVDNVGPAYPLLPRPPTDNVFQNNVDRGGASQNYSFMERILTTAAIGTVVRNNAFAGGNLGTYRILSTTTKLTPQENDTLLSDVTTQQNARTFNTVYKPGGASLAAVNEFISRPTLAASAVPVGAIRGFISQPNLAADFTGTLTQAYGYDFTPSNASAVLPGSVIGYSAGAGVGTGDAATSGTYTNYGFLAGAQTAAAGVGGAVINTGLRSNLSSGSSATTTNRGIWITGNGGALSTNYAIYSDSTARSLFSGPMTMTALPASAGAGGLYVCVDSTGVLYKKVSCP